MPHEKLKSRKQKRQHVLDENYNNWRTQLMRTQRAGGVVDGGDQSELARLQDYTLEDIMQEVYSKY